MNVPFLDLGAQLRPIRGEIDTAIGQVLDRCAFVAGDDVAAFEEEWAAFCGVRHGVAVSNGTDALHLALRAMGIGPGDEVITPAHTFVATAEAISLAGGTPVLVDVDPLTYTMDPDGVERAITSRTRALLPVHLYGLPADMDRLCDICARYNLLLLEDACQAHGAMYRGRVAGGLGDAAAFSFYPGKNLGAAGDAGAVTTNDDDLAQRMRLLRDHGSPAKYVHVEPGLCARMDTMQAAVLRVKLRYLEGWTKARQAVAARYRQALAAVPEVGVPVARDHATHVYHLFVVQVPERDRVREELAAQGIGTQIHYPRPIHLHTAYASLGYREGDFPVSEAVTERILSLPMYAELTESQIDAVVEALATAVSRRAPLAV